MNHIVLSKRENVGYITLNRAPANAYNLDLMTELHQAVVDMNADSSVGALVVNSQSEKFFCAGADIKEFQTNDTATNQKLVDMARRTTAALEQSDKVVIAQVSGHALGGGLELIMACDLRFAAKGNYLLGLPEIKLGLIPGNGGSQRLVRLVGLAKALEFLATGDSFSVNTATEMGLINQLVEKDQLDQFTFEYAKKIADGPLLAVTATKKALRQGVELTLEEGLALEQKLVNELYDTKDAAEGFNAFIDKRPAVFQGQ
ncbi:enoyl-CoA hydratase/isomerase family protein [Echinimonas agarilytica]|uniref:Enoyl-CoA hydratase/isomerase family protein n=1 Tax=Echinimonas agarilytica TaxID=1215918 RepID=A0AA41W779_9GAMM|nr:enoyl-CoA hydratase/isomerase family protein [Echinimonas agarilytica]MCM2679709.1 enoyl-CoA hydratase/isomerase family protein [Echinimonas agarilytica]